ncbi:piwi domain-containing protein [Colletotrichum camelliae]|nr:piwi domain-containing protein [Colletotrichum camelliae]
MFASGLRMGRLSGFYDEYATLKFLETTKVPAPRAFSFGIPSQGTDYGVGVCFLLMEELAGRPWDGRGDTSKVWPRLGEILAELEKHEFHQAGSLCVEYPQDQPSVSAAASDRFVCLDPWGPFETATDYYSAWAEQHLALIVDGQLYPQFPIEAYLVYRFLKRNASTLADGDDAFFLRHINDKGDHLMVDEQTNIVGIVDWQMARVVPRREAFALSLISADMGALCDGKVSLSAKDVALADALREKSARLAECMGDEKMRRFFWGLGLEHDWTFALPLAKAILQVFGVEQGWDEWREEQLRECKSDEPSPSTDTVRRCALTNHGFGLTNAHVVPREEAEWFMRNGMSRYGVDMRDVNDSRNMIRLRADIHRCFDTRMFSIVPKPEYASADPDTSPLDRSIAYVLHVFGSNIEEFSDMYHNTCFQYLDNTSREYLFARFAWTILILLKPFVLAGMNRSVIRNNSQVAGTWVTEELSGSKLSSSYGGGGREVLARRSAAGSGKTIWSAWQTLMSGMRRLLNLKKAEDGSVSAASFVYGGPQEIRFQLDPAEGQNTVLGNKPPGFYSVADYWQLKYGQAPDKTLPLVNLGTSSKPMFFPAERCTIIAGQPVRSKLSGDETTAMLDFACRSPFANAVSLERDSAAALGLDEPILKDFGITVDRRLLTVIARELPPPVVRYADDRALHTRSGSWNLGGVKIVKPGPKITNWNWVRITEGPNPRVSTEEVGESVQKFVDFLNESGVAIDTQVPNTAHQITVHRSTTTEDIRRAFAAIADYTTPAKGTTKGFFLLVILPRQNTTLYGAVKSLADVHFGFHTICSVERKFLQNNSQIFANIGLKWNLKNGGNNHAVKDTSDVVTSGKAMIVGYDVTHPTNMSNDRSAAPSLLGMVASVDRDLGQGPAVAWEQPSRQEMLGDELTEHFKSRLALWRERNQNTLPEFIIIYRDGVSESQFTQVLEIELPMIRKACGQLYPPKQRPKLAIIVSVKRHQTRFYPTSDQNMDPKSRNIKNGTVVDRGVTQACVWDFFLTAHTALKGTARPAHYTVLMDEIFREKYGVGVPAADQLEKITHNLCYLFGRATKAVSICPPAYYADILCDRARLHRPHLFDESDAASTATGSQTAAPSNATQVHPNLRDTMYYI